mmetsp:Transcript_7211/g.18042  ORF Transcript_7211/g.18042 Transcript_7211/m.18042 type:complete len:117 (-) Transcript_7211:119-469(-)
MAVGRQSTLCRVVFLIAGLFLLRAALLAPPTAPQAPPALTFVVATPTLRGGVARGASGFAGFDGELMSSPKVAMHGLPEPRPNDAMLPVDLNRSSLYWGLLFICVMSILFSSYFFN